MKSKTSSPVVTIPSPDRLRLTATYGALSSPIAPIVLFTDGSSDRMSSPTGRKSSRSHQSSHPTSTASQSRIPRPTSSREQSPPPFVISNAGEAPSTRPPIASTASDENPLTNGTSLNGSPNTSPWSSAVGRASLAGKSGRVIERLQSENDRLRRELKLVTLQREEEQRRADMARQGLENLRSINENLAGQATAERKAVERKERVLERLRGELDRERELRAREKLEAQVMREETDKTVVALQEDLRRESEMAKLWRTRHDTLSSSWKSLEEEHRRNFERMRTDLQSLQAARKSDLERVRRYETTVEQQAREVEKAKSSHENMKSLHERYKAEIERETRDMRMLARGNEAESERILEASKKALGEMRYLNNISQYVRGVGLDGEDGRDPLHPLPVAPPQRASNNIELGLSKNQKTESQREWELRD